MTPNYVAPRKKSAQQYLTRSLNVMRILLRGAYHRGHPAQSLFITFLSNCLFTTKNTFQVQQELSFETHFGSSSLKQKLLTFEGRGAGVFRSRSTILLTLRPHRFSSSHLVSSEILTLSLVQQLQPRLTVLISLGMAE